MRQVDVNGFENYQVTDDGRVWSKKSKKYLKQSYSNGYKVVTLYNNEKARNYLVHRLVANAFLPNPNGYKEINHKDEDKANNNVENLEYCDHSYNINYGTRNERQIDSISKRVYQYTKDLKLVNVFKSSIEAERQNANLNHRGISYACLGKLKTYKGYIWSHIPL